MKPKSKSDSIRILYALLLLSILAPPGSVAGETITFAATVSPVASLLKELVGERARVVTLVPPGFSPDLYEMTPSDLRSVRSSKALFMVDPRLDGWARNLEPSRLVVLSPLIGAEYRLDLPEDHHGPAGLDPHFWTDPLTVHAVVPALVERLCGLDTGGCPIYRNRGELFRRELLDLHEELSELLRPVKGKKVVLFHPSFQYMLHRYGISMAAVIEPYPGKEPSPRHIQKVIRIIRENRVDVVFSEPQLPGRPARIIADSAGVRLFELDPLGGYEGRTAYGDLLRHNARILRKALMGDAEKGAYVPSPRLRSDNT